MFFVSPISASFKIHRHMKKVHYYYLLHKKCKIKASAKLEEGEGGGERPRVDRKTTEKIYLGLKYNCIT